MTLFHNNRRAALCIKKRGRPFTRMRHDIIFMIDIFNMRFLNLKLVSCRFYITLRVIAYFYFFFTRCATYVMMLRRRMQEDMIRCLLLIAIDMPFSRWRRACKSNGAMGLPLSARKHAAFTTASHKNAAGLRNIFK